MTPDDALKLAQHVKRRKMDRPSIQLADFVIELLSATGAFGDLVKIETGKHGAYAIMTIGDSECRGGPCAISMNADDAEALGVAWIRAAHRLRAAQLPEQE